MNPRQDAQKAIRQHLRCDDAYVSGLVEMLNEGELEQIAGHLTNPAGAVAIAAVIYQARMRLAAEEAAVHHQSICKTVPLPDGSRLTFGDSRCDEPKVPGIRVCPDPHVSD